MALFGEHEDTLHRDRWRVGQLLDWIRNGGNSLSGAVVSRRTTETTVGLSEVWVSYMGGPHHRQDAANRIQASMVRTNGGAPITRFISLLAFQGEGLVMEADYKGGFRIHHYDYKPIWCMGYSTGELVILTEGVH